MLSTLRIKNLALVTDLTIEFQPGYNVITGETGAGKSILIGALNLVLGERADRTLVRSGSENCSVEALFHLEDVSEELNSILELSGLEPCENGDLVLKRAFSNAGTNRQFINGSPTSLAVLAQIGEWLVDIHGPHEHQSLLKPGKQLTILDAFARCETARAQFAKLVTHRAALENEKTALVVDEQTYAQQLDLLRFQVNEIEAARLVPEEEQRITADYQRTSNAARLAQLSASLQELLSEGEPSVLNQAGAVGRALAELGRLDPSVTPLLELHSQAMASLGELQTGISRYAETLELDPARLTQLEERLNIIQSLKRKYGSHIPEILQFGEEAKRRLDSLEQRDSELARINLELNRTEKEIWHAGQQLSTQRRKVIPELNRAVMKQLSDLGFKQSRFEVSLHNLDAAEFQAQASHLTHQGIDTVEFQFTPNPGEPPRALRAIASSGELARVMLALKSVLAVEDEIPVLVFDEVDANVGGETAHAVGDKMQQIARNRQVLCITHLPQVAAPAAAHYVATKSVKNGRTISEVTLLKPPERVTELARMLGGQSVAARRHAEALLKPA